MAYNPPAGNAVNFNFTDAYSPPTGSGLNFDMSSTGVSTEAEVIENINLNNPTLFSSFIFNLSISENFNAISVEAGNYLYNFTLAETINNTDTILDGFLKQDSITDTITKLDNTQVKLTVLTSLSDGFSFNELFQFIYSLRVQDNLFFLNNANHVNANVRYANINVNDMIVMVDTINGTDLYYLSVQSLLNAVSSSDSKFGITSLINDNLFATDVNDSVKGVLASVVSSFVLNQISVEDLIKYLEPVIEDIITLNDSNNVNLQITELLTDEITVSESNNATLSFLMTLTDSIITQDILNSNSTFYTEIVDSISTATLFVFNGEIYNGVVVNAINLAHSRYENYNFNSMCKFKNKYYGANGNKIYRLDGAKDEITNISASLTTGLLDFGTKLKKRIDDCFLVIKNNGDIYVKVLMDDCETYNYKLTQNNTKLKESRVKIGKGAKSVLWQFELTNDCGADFDLDTIQIHPIVLSRRV